MRVGAPEAEAEVEVRVDMNLDDVLVIGPECVLRVHKAVHSAPSYAAPPPMREASRAAASFPGRARRATPTDDYLNSTATVMPLQAPVSFIEMNVLPA